MTKDWDLTMKTFLAVTIMLGIILSAHAACDVCASDEYCNSTSCVCNSTVYTNTGSYPSPTIDCNGGKINVFISKCWLEKNGYQSTNIRLANDTCLATREIVNDTSLMTIHRPLSSNDCGTNAYTNTTHVIYANKLYIYAKTTPIQSRTDVLMNISCAFPLNINVNLNVTLHPIIGSTVINVPNTEASIPVNMVAYKDASFTTILSTDDNLYVDSTIYLSIYIPDLNVDTFKLKVIRIYASPAESGPTYDLLTNGCPASGITADLLSVLNNGNATESRFPMKVFQISGFSTVNITAVVQICTQNCQTDCSSISRSASSNDNTASVSLSLTANEHIDFNSANTLSMTWTLNTILFSLVLMKLL